MLFVSLLTVLEVDCRVPEESDGVSTLQVIEEEGNEVGVEFVTCDLLQEKPLLIFQILCCLCCCNCILSFSYANLVDSIFFAICFSARRESPCPP